MSTRILLLTLVAFISTEAHPMLWGQGQRNGPVGRAPNPNGVRPATTTSAPVPRQVQQIPRPFPALTPEHLTYIDQVLSYWEQKSNKIKRYRCQFIRWEYDPVFGPREVDSATGQQFAKTREQGTIKYASPDKGLFQVTEIVHYKRPQNPEDPRYVKIPGELGEHWVCDGATVYEFDHRKKVLIEQVLPPEMKGNFIADGPLPFLFGAEKEKIKDRYWLRVVTPSTVKNEYWLEAFPKRREDAQNFKKVRVIIDEAQWLPYAIQVFPPGFDARTKPAWTSYLFQNREVNWNQLPDQLNPFTRSFHRPTVPSGWRKEVQRYDDAPANPPRQTAARGQQAPRRIAPRQAQGPQRPQYGPQRPSRAPIRR